MSRFGTVASLHDGSQRRAQLLLRLDAEPLGSVAPTPELPDQELGIIGGILDQKNAQIFGHGEVGPIIVQAARTERRTPLDVARTSVLGSTLNWVPIGLWKSPQRPMHRLPDRKIH